MCSSAPSMGSVIIDLFFDLFFDLSFDLCYIGIGTTLCEIASRFARRVCVSKTRVVFYNERDRLRIRRPAQNHKCPARVGRPESEDHGLF